eukprot:jgi/Undpi1/5938/HiC_scaffold_2.g01212.m1
MSCIHLHLGQAGNQIGKSFWALAEDEFFVDDRGGGVGGGGVGRGGRGRDGGGGGGGDGGSGRRRARGSTQPLRPSMRPGGTAMFHEDGSARCLAVDSEPKVVHSFQNHVGSLRPENAIFSQSGLANNWAMGFASCRGGNSPEGGLFSRCMDGMRKEAERCCWLNSVVMTHSLAGGTGSGLGSGLLQALRDEYPSLYLISACVGPFGTGDTPLQHYNSVLALHHLQVFADAVIYRGNDDLLQESLASARKGLSHSNAIGGGSCSGHGVGDWGGRGGGKAGRWRPVGLLSRGNIGSGSSTSSSSRAVNTIGGFAVRAGGVSMADMNASLSLDVASLFFPTSPPPPVKHTNDFSSIDVLGHALGGGGGGFRPGPPRPAPGEHYRHHRREVTSPRPFDGGCLMSAACPLPGAKFVDLRSTLSFGLGHRSARELSQDRPVKLTDERRWGAGGSEEARARGAGGRFGWAALAGGLGKVAPLCPRRAGGSREGDACVAAYHVVRGVDVDEGPAATAATVAAAAVSAAAGEASKALRGHHECSEWRTATDASCSPALLSRGMPRSVTTVCNQTRIRGVLEDVLTRAETKFNARAYLHWYHRYGLEDEDFLAAFEGVRTVERGYDGLARAFGGGGNRAGR